MLRRFGIFAVAATMISGCASVKHIPVEQSAIAAIARIADKEVVVVKRPMPNFVALTPGNSAAFLTFGLPAQVVLLSAYVFAPALIVLAPAVIPVFGAWALGISAGNSLVKENGIPDPDLLLI